MSSSLLSDKQEIHLTEELEQALPLSRKLVPKELLLAPKRSVLLQNALTDWACILLFWIGMSVTPTWTYPMWAALVASRVHAFGAILHDLIHMPLRKKTMSIRLIELLTGYPIGSTLNAMRYHHLRHHKDSGMQTDPYFKKGIKRQPLLFMFYTLRGMILILFWIIRSAYGTLAYYLPEMRNSYGRIFLQDRSGRDLTHSEEVIQCASEERWLLLFHLLISGGVCLLFPRQWVFGYLIPLLITGLLAGYRLLLEHNYEATTDRKLETIIQSTHDHHLQGIGAFFLAPRNIGYHIVHHLHPQVAWYHLPNLRKWYVKQYPHLYPEVKKNRILRAFLQRFHQIFG
ncbi:MAG: fatty acid desaturase [Bacteroidota bacterium]